MMTGVRPADRRCRRQPHHRTCVHFRHTPHAVSRAVIIFAKDRRVDARNFAADSFEFTLVLSLSHAPSLSCRCARSAWEACVLLAIAFSPSVLCPSCAQPVAMSANQL